ncbi:hypothetical protein TNCT_392221 [Trichonephila clavata]|uniref:Uncharacterized protein n=1 Tax=Trichonephila clavata TaxID=2740835 RepID=A0A8X6FDT3_TRICU|nr:hypothetical protein TNCT_392221 [Trichonephila clavata]
MSDMAPPVELPEDFNMEERTPEEQACMHLSYLWTEARLKENRVKYFRQMIETGSQCPFFPEEEMTKYWQGIPVLEDELQTILGEIALVTCPIDNCPTHTFRRDQNAKTDTAITSKVKPKENSVKVVDNNLNENNEKPIVNNTNEKSKTKRGRQEEFKLPKKFAHVTKDLPPVQPCTTKNSFAALETVKNTEDASDPPPPVTPKIKPIMMRINKNYNLRYSENTQIRLINQQETILKSNLYHKKIMKTSSNYWKSKKPNFTQKT